MGGHDRCVWRRTGSPQHIFLTHQDGTLNTIQQGKLIAGLCLGTFVLGDAGLLDGKEATTHWMAREVFARRFPRSVFRPDVLYVADDNIITSAGTTPSPYRRRFCNAVNKHAQD